MSENADDIRAYEFGPFTLEVADYRLIRNGRPVPLAPKVFELLVALIERRGHSVEKERLMQMLWPSVSVDEGSLTQLVFQLRKTLGETASQQQYIETIPKRGYRFVAEVAVRCERNAPMVPDFGTETHFRIYEDQELETQSNGSKIPVRPTPKSYALGSWRYYLRTVGVRRIISLGIVGMAALGIVFISVSLFRQVAKQSATTNTSSYQDFHYRKLTASGRAILPAISPDGNLTAYVVDDVGKQAIWVRQIASTSRVQITQPAARSIHSLTFASDGQSLYFVEGEKSVTAGSLIKIPVLGGAERKILDNVNSPISFSPDGKRFAFIRGSVFTEETALMIASADGSNIQTLSVRTSPDFYSRYGVAWSPDGNMILCGAGRSDPDNSHRQVITVSTHDGKETPVGTEVWEELGEVAWLRDGSGIIVNALRRDSEIFAYQLWHLAYPSGAAQKFLPDLANYEGISVAHQSDVIAIGRSERISKIWLTPADRPSEARQIRSSMSDNYSESFGLSWTSDGKIVYGSHGSGNSDVWIMDSDGRNQRQLTFGREREFWPTVSPDDRYIVFVTQGASGLHIWRMDIDGSNRRQLTFGKGEAFPSFSPDGKTIFFSSVDPGWPVIGMISIEGGETRLLTRARSMRPMVSPDGKTVACLYLDEGLARLVPAVIPIEGGEPIKVFKDLPLANWLMQWTPDGKGLAYISTQNGVSNIWVKPISNGPPKRLTDFTEDKIYRFAWSQDGKHIAIDRGINLNDVILLTFSGSSSGGVAGNAFARYKASPQSTPSLER